MYLSLAWIRIFKRAVRHNEQDYTLYYPRVQDQSECNIAIRSDHLFLIITVIVMLAPQLNTVHAYARPSIEAVSTSLVSTAICDWNFCLVESFILCFLRACNVPSCSIAFQISSNLLCHCVAILYTLTQCYSCSGHLTHQITRGMNGVADRTFPIWLSCTHIHPCLSKMSEESQLTPLPEYEVRYDRQIKETVMTEIHYSLAYTMCSLQSLHLQVQAKESKVETCAMLWQHEHANYHDLTTSCVKQAYQRHSCRRGRSRSSLAPPNPLLVPACIQQLSPELLALAQQRCAIQQDRGAMNLACHMIFATCNHRYLVCR